MARVGPISRRNLIRNPRSLGFGDPVPRGRHEMMRRGSTWVVIPNPHRGDISADLLARLLRQAAVSREEWDKL